MRGIEDLPDPAGKAVLLRLDLNVPLKRGERGLAVADDFRIVSALPAIRALLKRNARVIAVSHLGELTGTPDPAYNMDPVRQVLSQFVPDVELQENLRFFPGELNADPDFVQSLVHGRDLYVNDAFATAHRPHASIIGPPAYLPSAAGPLMHRELTALRRLREAPERPFALVLGGAKLRDKLRALAALSDSVDRVLVGGAMANAFAAASASRNAGEGEFSGEVMRLCDEALRRGLRLILPTDVVAGDGDGPPRVVPASRVPPGCRAMDIGPETAARFVEEIGRCRTVFWNGPLGVFEKPGFEAGSFAVAHALARSSAFVVVGGGETAQYVRSLGLADRLGHVSTGGGATLHYLGFGDLPALAALRGEPGGVPERSRPYAGRPVRGGASQARRS